KTECSTGQTQPNQSQQTQGQQTSQAPYSKLPKSERKISFGNLPSSDDDKSLRHSTESFRSIIKLGHHSTDGGSFITSSKSDRYRSLPHSPERGKGFSGMWKSSDDSNRCKFRQDTSEKIPLEEKLKAVEYKLKFVKECIRKSPTGEYDLVKPITLKPIA
ncbi:unnamed protein product, partial [Meganyctiphanes norvegica]